MKTLVTGATGFIGEFLVRELIRRGHHVRALVRPGRDTGKLEKLGVEIRSGDLLNRESLSGICDGIDTVFHLAGRVTDWGTREQFYRAIYDATMNLIDEAAGNARRFLYMSSVAAIGFGRHMKGIRETDTAYKSGIPYNDAKLDTESLVLSHHEARNIACTVIRPTNVIGPGSVWVRDIIEKMKRMPMPLVDGGRHSSSLISVDNLVDGTILAASSDTARGKTYHFRDDWEVTWKEYINDLGGLIGKKPFGSLPYYPARMLATILDFVCTPMSLRPPVSRMSIETTGRNNDIDNTLAKTELGWKTKVTYPEAMRSIGAWVRDTYGQG